MGPEDRAESTLQRGRVPQWIWRPGDAVADRSSDGRVSAALAAAGRGLCEGRRTGIVDLGVAVEQGQPDRDHGDQQSRGPHLQSNDENMMVAVGRQLATTIEKVRLYEETCKAYE